MEKGNTNLGGGMEYILFLNMTEDKDNFLTQFIVVTYIYIDQKVY